MIEDEYPRRIGCSFFLGVYSWKCCIVLHYLLNLSLKPIDKGVEVDAQRYALLCVKPANGGITPADSLQWQWQYP